MGKNLVQKILAEHLVSGEIQAAKEIAIKIDQTLTQDATGTMAYLQFEAMEIDRVRTKLSVSYVDHNMLQTGFENADDHRFLQCMAARYGVFFSRPGNGICHQVHLERFSVPGQTLLGSDSHTPTSGGVGMIAIGAGGLDIAVSMGGVPFYLKTPKVVKVFMKGKLKPWVSAMDIILEMLRRFTVKGGVGKIFEYCGPGVASLSVPERATITNMGAELGATTSIFPSDERTKEYFNQQKREKDFRYLEADADAAYDEEITLDLGKIEPLIAQPYSPDNVCRVKDVEGTKVDQVCVGSCTNSSIRDMLIFGSIMKGKKVHPGVSVTVNPGSRQVFEVMAQKGVLADIIQAGVRILESACGPCIGMGQAPPSKGVSLRTFNRNFEGRSGTRDAMVYLASPVTAAAAALSGVITDPRKLGKPKRLAMPKEIPIDDAMIIEPPEKGTEVEIIRGPNIKPLPKNTPLPGSLRRKVLLKVGDNITTDHIMPAGSKILPLRSNIPAISEYVFNIVDPKFPERAKAEGGGFIVGGENYGQGSSREHAALAPMYLGVKAVIAKSFARIHLANLINFGIIPLTFENAQDYDLVEQGDLLEMARVNEELQTKDHIIIKDVEKNTIFNAKHGLTKRQVEIVLAGGLLKYASLLLLFKKGGKPS